MTVLFKSLRQLRRLASLTEIRNNLQKPLKNCDFMLKQYLFLLIQTLPKLILNTELFRPPFRRGNDMKVQFEKVLPIEKSDNWQSDKATLPSVGADNLVDFLLGNNLSSTKFCFCVCNYACKETNWNFILIVGNFKLVGTQVLMKCSDKPQNWNLPLTIVGGQVNAKR